MDYAYVCMCVSVRCLCKYSVCHHVCATVCWCVYMYTHGYKEDSLEWLQAVVLTV